MAELTGHEVRTVGQMGWKGLANGDLLSQASTRFDAVPPLLDDHRKDRIFRFIAVIFLAHAGRLDIWQEADHILVKQREAYQQGQDISGRITEAT